MTLVSAFTTEAADQRIVSPLFCGSHPYLHGSLTYRFTVFKVTLKIIFVKEMTFVSILKYELVV